MRGIRLTPDAQSDILEIRRFTVSQWGAAQAQRYLTELRRAMQLLAETPSLGKARPDVGPLVSSFPHASHVIYYIAHQQQLVVFALLHKRMVPARHLSERGIV
jgi:toxin ParE1/3/4